MSAWGAYLSELDPPPLGTVLAAVAILSLLLLALPAGGFTDYTQSLNPYAKPGDSNVSVMDFQVNSTSNATFSNITSLSVNYTGDSFTDVSKVSVYNGSSLVGSNGTVSSKNVTVALNTSKIPGANGNLSNISNAGNRTLLTITFDVNSTAQHENNVSGFVGNITGNNVTYYDAGFRANGNTSTAGNMTIDSKGPRFGINSSSWAAGQGATTLYRGWTTEPDIWVTNSPENNRTVIVVDPSDATSGLNASSITANFSQINGSLGPSNDGLVTMVDDGSVAEDTANDGNYTANVSIPPGADLGFSSTYDYKNPGATSPMRLANVNVSTQDNVTNANVTKAPALVYIMDYPPIQALTGSGNTDLWRWNESATVNMQNQTDMTAVDMHFRAQLNDSGTWIDVAGLNFSSPIDMLNTSEMSAFMNATKSFNASYDPSTGYVSVTLDGSEFSDLDKEANVTMHNVNRIGIDSQTDADNATVLEDSSLNASLNLTYSSELNGTVNFTVGHFSTYSVDSKDPVTELTSPTDGSTVSGSVSVEGTAQDGSWGNWNVSVRKNGSTGSWTEIGTGTSNKNSTTLATWSTGSYSDGDYDVRLKAEDAGNRTNSTMVTVTVSNPSDTVGGGGGGGAAPGLSVGLTGEFSITVSKFATIFVSPGSSAEVTMPEGSPFESFRLTAAKEILDPSFRVGEHVAKPDGVDDPGGPVNKYVSATTSLEEDEVESVDIRFGVSRNWIQDNGLSPEDVVLSRWDPEEGTWTDLETDVVSGDGEVTLSATSPGFSTFAVRGVTVSATATPTETATQEPGTTLTAVPTETETPTPTRTSPGMTLLASVTGLAAAVYAARRR